MDVMYLVTSGAAGAVLLPLLRASRRRGAAWGCFFTDDGVQVLGEAAIRELMACAAAAVACELSWVRFAGSGPCPVELGSQTDNSAMVARARHVISL